MDVKDELQFQDSSRDRSRSRSPPSDDDRENRDRDSDRDRDRRRERTDRRRSERPRSSVSKSSSGGRRAPAERRIYVSNIPYEYKWQDLKDLFRKEVGEVSYVEMFNDENNRPRGCAIIEFDTNDLVNKAIDVMHRHELKGRKLVVKEDFDTDRDGHGRIMKGGRDMSRGGSGGRNDFNNRNNDQGPPSMGGGGMGMGGGGGGAVGAVGGSPNKFGNTYGLSTVFLESLGISGPLVNKVFVANLDYKVDDKQLKDVFRIAGKVTHVEINKDQDGKSRGFGVVQFEHPVEAVQAISMLHNQSYYDRKMSVRMDRVSEKQENPSNKLPPGLRSLGMGLGVNGMALNDVSTINTGMSGGTGGGMGTGGMGGMTAGMGGAMGNTGMGGGMATGMGMMGAMGNNMGGMDSMQAANNMGMGNMGVGGMGNMGGAMGNMGGAMVPGMGGGMAGGMGAGMAGGMTGGMGMGTAGMVTPVSNMGSLGSGLNSGMGSNMNRGGGGNMGGSSNNSISSSTGYGNYSRGGSSGVTREYNHSSNQSNQNSTGNYSGTQRNIIQIGNLPLDYTWQSLRDLCREFGEIRFAEIRSKGTGTVRFQSDADARRAVEMLDRQRLDGRILDVSHV